MIIVQEIRDEMRQDGRQSMTKPKLCAGLLDDERTYLLAPGTHELRDGDCVFRVRVIQDPIYVTVRTIGEYTEVYFPGAETHS